LVDKSQGAELARMAVELDKLARYADVQERKASQLERALESRAVIEQAVGMLAERFDLSLAEGFDLLSRAASDGGRDVHTIATELTQTRATPEEVTAARTAG
jgi:AmiR/NasT family two-component response regulator